MNWSLISLPIIAAAIGWFTNWIAVKMLFRPQKPINLGLFTIQGVFPKRQKQFAEKIGQLVANQLFSFDDLKSKINTESSRASIVTLIDVKIEHFLRTKLSTEMPMLAFIMNDALVMKIKGTLMNEITDMLPQVLDNFTDNLGKNLDINAIVTQKVENFTLDKMEEIMMSIMSKELKFIEIIGAILGFIIGCIQMMLI